MILKRIRGIGPILFTAALALPLQVAAQGVPTIDLTSIAKIGEVLAEAKLQVREMIASNLKLDELKVGWNVTVAGNELRDIKSLTYIKVMKAPE